MAESLEHWTRRVRRGLSRVPGGIHEATLAWARDLEDRLRLAAPRRTGALRDSIKVKVDPERPGDLSSIQIESDDPAAVAHEEGGQVRGRPWLAVPMQRQLRDLPGPRSDIQLFSLRTRDGRVFLATNQGGQLDVRWRLIHSVDQSRLRPFIAPTVLREADDLPDRILDVFRKELTRGG